ncbi:hypothetical protein GGR50DRAFT_230376 [Xylaria sp. CBS 124048]|nr:hypothetical protein GGR50DRAFT_230376 [Xylaria sp. CBS 124048]
MCDHNLWETRDLVRSSIDKPASAGSVVESVTTSESPVSYVFVSFFFFFFFFWVFCRFIVQYLFTHLALGTRYSDRWITGIDGQDVR